MGERDDAFDVRCSETLRTQLDWVEVVTMQTELPEQLRSRLVTVGPLLSVVLYELSESPSDARDAYGSRSWPAAAFIARHLAANPSMIAGRRVLELGCGNGLASLAAARLGASQVLATDYRALPLSLVSSAARRAGCSPFELSTQVFDFASPMPPAAVVHTRSRASRIPPPEEPLPAHDILLAADIGYSPALAWRLGERCRESIAAGGRVLVAESRQNPACRAAFSEALNHDPLGRREAAADDEEPPSLLKLQPVERVRDSLGEGDAEAVAVGGDAEAMMWVLDAGDRDQ